MASKYKMVLCTQQELKKGQMAGGPQGDLRKWPHKERVSVLGRQEGKAWASRQAARVSEWAELDAL